MPVTNNKWDFSGYATKSGVKCGDGRTIQKDAFKHQDGTKVPLVWQHDHSDPSNVLGHAILENREDGVFAYGFFNGTPDGLKAKALVQHGDIDSMSIWANELIEKTSVVLHGMIREVSLVLSGKNPGAKILSVVMAHGDGTETELEGEAVVHTGETLTLPNQLQHEGTEQTKTDEPKTETAKDSKAKTIAEIIQGMTDEEKEAMYAVVAKVAEAEVAEAEAQHSTEGDVVVKSNVFEKKEDKTNALRLSHAQFDEIVTEAKRVGSFKQAFMAHSAVMQHAQTYGIENIEYLFPDAKTLTNVPDFIKRDTEWVSTIVDGARHNPFSRIKSVHADITADEARAKGYIKGNLKTEEVFTLLRRTTTPTTVYKKQKIDRDDKVDIVDFDVVAWIKVEMKMMLKEELGRAALISDGRSAANPDHINTDNIRPIYTDNDLYAHHVLVSAPAPDVNEYDHLIESIIRARKFYKGSGNPVMYTTTDILTEMLLLKDANGHRMYRTQGELEAELRVSKIVEVPVMENVTREVTEPGPATLELLAILVNPRDYTWGADKGGEVSMFEDFDIDFNQEKFLIETRLCGCLTIPKSALVFEKAVPPAG